MQTTPTEGAGETSHIIGLYSGTTYVVMQVKKATFQRMGSGGKGRTENRWDVSGAGQSSPSEVYLIFPR